MASRAVSLLSRWALGDLGLDRLQLFAEPSNGASLRVAERTGFQREGLLRSYAVVNDRRVDYVVFSLLPADLGNMERS
jgi:RimJ/RimL family protein N-acetyltransferase